MKDNNNLLTGIIIAVAVFLLLGSFGYGGMMGYGMMGFGFMPFGFLFMTLILVALVLFIMWLIKEIQKSGRSRRNKR